MTRSESTKALSAALCGAQRKLKPVKRNARNEADGYSYADLAAVMRACRPIQDAGISIQQFPRLDIGAVASERDWFVTVETRFEHAKSGEWTSETLTMPLAKTDAKGVGEAISYARRYGLQAMAGIVVEGEDSDMASLPKPATSREVTDVIRSVTKKRTWTHVLHGDQTVITQDAELIARLESYVGLWLVTLELDIPRGHHSHAKILRLVKQEAMFTDEIPAVALEAAFKRSTLEPEL